MTDCVKLAKCQTMVWDVKRSLRSEMGRPSLDRAHVMQACISDLTEVSCWLAEMIDPHSGHIESECEDEEEAT